MRISDWSSDVCSSDLALPVWRKRQRFFDTEWKMSLIVHKYGGTSMGSVERIQNVARRFAKWHAAGHQLVVVPSAMSGETNRLLGMAKEISIKPDGRELDLLAATGEQASSAFLDRTRPRLNSS